MEYRGLSIYACTRQALSRIYRYSLTYEAISDWICNCCQRLHEFFFTSCQSVIKIFTRPNFWKISCVAKTIFAHCSKIKLTFTSRKSLFVVIPCRYNFRARLSSCEVSLLLCVFFAFLFHSLLFHFRFMLCCRF